LEQASDNNGGRDRMIGFRMSSDETRSRSVNDRNQCTMQKKDRNFLLYENRSIIAGYRGLGSTSNSPAMHLNYSLASHMSM
jgi:hypothetical protein